MPTMKVADVKVRDGFNVRKAIDVEGLAESVKLVGVLQPIVLDADGYVLAGHRRLAAANLAGLQEIPYVTAENGAESKAVGVSAAENIARVNLSPAEEADAIDRMLKAGYTEDGAAAVLGITKALVTRRMVLLRIPEDLRALWGPEGSSRLDTAPLVAELVEKIPKLAPIILAVNRIAETQGDVPHYEQAPVVEKLLGRRPSAYLESLCHFYAQNSKKVKLPKLPGEFLGFWIEGEEINERELAALKSPKAVKEKYSELHKKLWAAYCYNTRLRVEQADMDAAVAAQAVIDWPGQFVIYDAAWMRSHVKDAMLPRFEQQANAAIKRQKAPSSRAGAGGGSGQLSVAEQKRKLREKHERDAQKRWSAQAPAINEELGLDLQRQFLTVPVDATVAKLFAEESLGSRPPKSGGGYSPYNRIHERSAARLAAAGLRYVMPGWVKRKPKPTKADPGKTVPEYLTIEEAEKKLWSWFDQAKTPEEIFGRALVIHAAARWAIEEALPRSQRIMGGSGSHRTVLRSHAAVKALEKLTEPALPAAVKRLIGQMKRFDPDKPQPGDPPIVEPKKKAAKSKAAATEPEVEGADDPGTCELCGGDLEDGGNWCPTCDHDELDEPEEEPEDEE